MIDEQLGFLKYAFVSRFQDNFPILAGAFRRDVLWTVPVANMRAGMTDVLVEKAIISYNMFDIATGALIPNNETSLRVWLNTSIAFNRTPNLSTADDKEFSCYLSGDSCKQVDVGILWTPHLADFNLYFTAACVNAAGAGNTQVEWSVVLMGQFMK